MKELDQDFSLGRETLYIIKIGGNVIDDTEVLQSFLAAFASIKAKKILVHGGGKIATSLGEKLGIVSEYIDGRRITNDETIHLVTMVYGGLINKKITASLQALQCNAIGLCGVDANILPAKKRPSSPIDYGWVGDVKIETIETKTWQLFLDNGLVPVIAPLTHDEKSHILNTNADTIAGVIALGLANEYNVNLIYCFEKNGILSEVHDLNSVIPELKAENIEQLKKENKLFAGILPKLDNAVMAIAGGVQKVHIGHSDNLLLLIKSEGGTAIKP